MDSGDGPTFDRLRKEYKDGGVYDRFQACVKARARIPNRAGVKVVPPLVMASDPIIAENSYDSPLPHRSWPSFLSGARGCAVRTVTIDSSHADAAGLSVGTRSVLAWSPAYQADLTYHVQPRHGHDCAAVAAHVQAAGDAWSSACAVRFKQVDSEAAAVFVVRMLDDDVSTVDTYAEACFPHTHHDNRFLLLFPRLLRTMREEPELAATVFLHELGHVLGLRHEFLRLGSSFTDLGDMAVPVTPNDADSAMQPPKQGRAISAMDRSAMAWVYGPPVTVPARRLSPAPAPAPAPASGGITDSDGDT